MRRSRFRAEKTRDAGNTGGETRLQLLLPSGTYATIAHFKDEKVARMVVQLLNQRSAKQEPPADTQRELLPVDHRSVTQRRLKYRGLFTRTVNPEAFYHAAWRRENDHRRTRPLLPGILCPDADRDKGWEAVPVSRRDAMVAATVIQWLGTNVGRGFVLGVEREIEQARQEQERLGAERRRLRPDDPLATPGGAVRRRKSLLDATRKRLDEAAKTKGKP